MNTDLVLNEDILSTIVDNGGFIVVHNSKTESWGVGKIIKVSGTEEMTDNIDDVNISTEEFFIVNYVRYCFLRDITPGEWSISLDYHSAQDYLIKNGLPDSALYLVRRIIYVKKTKHSLKQLNKYFKIS